MIPQIRFNYDYIEVLNNRYFKLSSRQFVSCPFNEDDFGKVSPRLFQNFQTGTHCDGGFFASSVFNSFPEIEQRVEFLNKFYQCFLYKQLPHKVPKLLCTGEGDSGKTSWARIIKGMLPASATAGISREKCFGTSMISEETQFIFIDEWNEKLMDADMAKVIFQGGQFMQSIKHEAPKFQNMHAGIYITCNNIPDFGREQTNVEKRLCIFETKTLPERILEAEEWMANNGMNCLVWMTNVINSNIKYVSKSERFYELPFNVQAKNCVSASISDDQIMKIKMISPNFQLVTLSKNMDEVETGKLKSNIKKL